MAGQLQVGDDLRFVHWTHGFDGLELNYERTFDEQIDAKFRGQWSAFVGHRHGPLEFEADVVSG